MNNDLNEILETEENDILGELNEFFLSVFELTKSAYDTVVDSAFFNKAIDTVEELDAEAEKLSKIYKGIKVVASIPDRLFLRKFERLCLGIENIPENKRQKYMQKISKKKFNKETSFILDVINKAEDLDKMDIFSLLWEAKIDEKLNDDKFRRYVIMTANTMLQDLKFMSQNITNNSFYITSMEEEGLVSQGWIIYAGLGMGTAEHSGGNLYEYTAAAKEYCKCVWNVIPGDKASNGAIMFTGETISDEDIKALFPNIDK